MALQMGAPGYSGRPLSNQSNRMKKKITMTQTCWVAGEIKKKGETIDVSPVIASTLFGNGQAEPAKATAKKKAAKPVDG